MNSGLTIIDKPPGITSFKALFAIKKRFNTKRVGHAGTLDLSASGLIVAAIGKCTRLLPYIEAQDKTYSFDLHLGILTDTLEPTGNILKQDDNAARTAEEMDRVLQTFIGEIEQVPPMFSAIKINGKRASDLALKGLDVELKSRKVFIRELRRTGESSIYCKCSKGTYIRSLARDIAEKLGTYGVAGNIRRLAIGGLSVEQACDRLIPPQELFDWQIVNVGDEDARKILNGMPVQVAGENFVFIAQNGHIIAVAEAQNGWLIPKFQL